MNSLLLELWRTVSPFHDPEAAMDRLRDLLRCGEIKRHGETSLVFSDDDASTVDPEIQREAEAVFRVVVQRYRAFHELILLRETAEAEKQAALVRLGRKDLGDEIIGKEQGLREVLARVEQVATSDLPVLILGETGTGKELVARTIHHRSTRAKHPFHRVNCGAIPPELIDSQLFGHERGSFTGATDLRKGWFERADGGTLFLDEIGELPQAAQVRLLRILQDGHYERVGGQKSLSCDVRIVAATNRDLSRMVDDGGFRADLWYRIAVFPVQIPPLRDRQEDIPDLAEHFARRAAMRFGLSPAHPTKEELRLLLNYSWPGNIRELGSVIDRAAILGNGKRLDIAAALGGPGPVLATLAVPEPPTAPENRESEMETLDSRIRRHIENAIRKCHGRIDGPFGAARILGLNPNTLRSKMRKLGIKPRKEI